MPPKSVFITGCNRGIGLGLVRHFLNRADPPKHVFATCRDPDKAEELSNLAKNHSALKVLKLETTDHSSFDQIVQTVSEVVGKDGLNLLILNAATYPSERNNVGVTAEGMRQAFEVNTIAPLFLAKAMVPLLKIAADQKASSSTNMSVDRAAIVMMSTAVASVAENSGGGAYAYRSSKTALNMVMKNLSLELKDSGILVMSMHPGWVKTDMGGPNATVGVDDCCSTMLNTLGGLSSKDHGTFLRYNNTSIPW